MVGAPAQEIRVGDHVKRRYVELATALPNRQSKVGANSGRFAKRQCQRLHKSLLQHGGKSGNRLAAGRIGLFVLDHRLPAEIGKVAISLGAEFLFEHLVADLLEARRVGLRLLF